MHSNTAARSAYRCGVNQRTSWESQFSHFSMVNGSDERYVADRQVDDLTVHLNLWS
jgi:hypothetical protein